MSVKTRQAQVINKMLPSYLQKSLSEQMPKISLKAAAAAAFDVLHFVYDGVEARCASASTAACHAYKLIWQPSVPSPPPPRSLTHPLYLYDEQIQR